MWYACIHDVPCMQHGRVVELHTIFMKIMSKAMMVDAIRLFAFTGPALHPSLMSVASASVCVCVCMCVCDFGCGVNQVKAGGGGRV
jgi:hypothetical protein